jgi:hypothetical protein
LYQKSSVDRFKRHGRSCSRWTRTYLFWFQFSSRLAVLIVYWYHTARRNSSRAILPFPWKILKPYLRRITATCALYARACTQYNTRVVYTVSTPIGRFNRVVVLLKRSTLAGPNNFTLSTSAPIVSGFHSVAHVGYLLVGSFVFRLSALLLSTICRDPSPHPPGRHQSLRATKRIIINTNTSCTCIMFRGYRYAFDRRGVFFFFTSGERIISERSPLRNLIAVLPVRVQQQQQ